MNTQPFVSVGLPVYNAEVYLARTIESHLVQSHSNFELIISDNGSSDATRSICEDYCKRDSRIRYVREEKNRGLSWNHTRVFELSTGEYFRWGAADDLPSPGLIEETVRLLEDDRRIVLCVPHTKNIDSAGEITATLPRTLELETDDAVERAKAVLMRSYQMVFPQGLMRRDVLLATDRRWNYFGWDFILLLELALRGRVVLTRESHLLRRLHAAQASRVQRDSGAGVARVEPSFNARFVFPHWRWQLERFRAVMNAPIGLGEKADLSQFLVRHTWWARRSLVRDVTTVFNLALGKSSELSL